MTDTPTTTDRIHNLLRSTLMVFEDQPLKNDAQLGRDLNADSLDLVEIEMMMEDEFAVELPENSLKLETTVGDLIALVPAA